ncbi:MAG: hypothetical protein GY801_22070 [bacterium]|nr:hypothetical protein [bacterium]
MKRMLMNRRGSATVFIVIGVVLLAIAAFAAMQLFPLYWDHWNFEDTVENEMLHGLVPPYTDVEGTIAKKIVSLLKNIGADYKEEHIKVEVLPNNSKVFVEVWYTRSHHLPFYQNPKQFYLKSEHATILPKKINIPTRAPLPNVE